MRKRTKYMILLATSLILAAGIGGGWAGGLMMGETAPLLDSSGGEEGIAGNRSTMSTPAKEAAPSDEWPAEGVLPDAASADEGSERKAALPSGKKASAVTTAAAAEVPKGTALITENAYLQLYLNKKTTEVVVRDKRTAELWSTNPADRDQDKIAKAMNRSDLDSQLILSYFNDKGYESLINNASESIEKGQFEIEELEHGVKIIYEIGSSEKGLGAIPQVISKERFEERILNQIEDEQARSRLRNRFFFNEAKQQYERKEMQDYIVKDVVAILESIGYTADEAKQDSASADGESSIKESAAPRFIIPIVYELNEDQLLARIDTAGVQDTEAFPLHKITLLPFFGAAGLDDEGYMLVPDGSGALIDLNQNHAGARAYELPLYGEDATLKSNESLQPQYAERSRLPIFGMKRGNQAMLAIIEEGDAQASIFAEPSGRLNSYNRISASFGMKNMESVQFRAGSVARQIPKYSPMYSQGIAVRYSFLSGEQADYVGMAEQYRQYLIERHGMKRIQENGELPFVLELVGGIPVRKTFLGIPYESVEPVTTFDEAIDILKQLQQKGIKRIQLKYSGWFNEGYYHTLPSRIKPDRVLGGTEGLQKLIQYAEEHQIEWFMDTAFQRVYEKGKGFKADRDGARFLNRRAASKKNVDLVTTNQGERLYYVLAPDKLLSVVDHFIQSVMAYQVRSISLRDLGEDLNSSVSDKKTTTRQETLSIVTDSLQRLKEQMDHLMISGGNAYSIPYASTIVDAPLTSSRFNIESEEIPFYSIVVHGYVDHAGKPLNLERDQDPRTSMLRMLETGSLPAYQWFYEDPSVIRDTKLNDLYSASYVNWMDEASTIYQEVSAVLQAVQNEPIIHHRKLQEQVYETTFANELRILVNYNREAVTIDGITIKALGYRTVGGGA